MFFDEAGITIVLSEETAGTVRQLGVEVRNMEMITLMGLDYKSPLLFQNSQWEFKE